MKRNLKKAFGLAMILALSVTAGTAQDQKANAVKKAKDPIKEKDMAIFHIDIEKKKITDPVKNLKDFLKFKFYSVTTDQPLYWPSEEVFLKVLLPASPNKEVDITIQKKDATPLKLGKVKLNAAGMLVQSVMSAKKSKGGKMEPGEYRVDVKTADGKISSYTTFTIVEGALGAVSFGYDFEQLTDAKKLAKANGGWFMGNAEGVGMRWGNGLNVKNEVRVLNQPFTGEATVKTRCFLPGCDGVEGGPEQKIKIENGKLEAVLDVGGHSGPFGIEVITGKGSVSYLFGKSGHVERQVIAVSGRLSRNFSATMAPYENTTEVPGREIYITKDSDSNDPVQIQSVIADENGDITLLVKKDLTSPRIVVYYPVGDDEFQSEEIALPGKWARGSEQKIRVRSPFSFIGVGGFVADQSKATNGSDYHEGWAIAFNRSGITATVEAPASGLPNKTIDIMIRTMDRNSGKGIPVYGILEVFDNRVQSKSAKEPLISSLGDSIRDFANYLVSWRDLTGYDDELEKKDYAEEMDASGANIMSQSRALAYKSKAAPSPSTTLSGRNGTVTEAGTEPQQDQEEVREGEKKVLFCGMIHTDDQGAVNVTVPMPPQTGRLKVRFTAVRKYDYTEVTKDVDVKKSSYLEVNVMPLLMPGAKIRVKGTVVNSERKNVRLTVTGAGMNGKFEKNFSSGAQDFTFEVEGRTYGKLELKLADDSGKTLDRREVTLNNIGSYPATFSDIMISDGNEFNVPAGSRVAVYSNPGMMLQGMVMNIVTSMYSWFGHSEALTSSAVIRAILLRAMDEKVIDDEGLRDTIKSDLVKTVKDLKSEFFDKNSFLFRPYACPCVMTDELWSLWAAKNLSQMIRYLEGSENLKKEFRDTIQAAREMTDSTLAVLKKKRHDVNGEALYDFEKGKDILPVEINGKVVYQLVTDTAVVDWFLSKMYKNIDMDPRVRLNKAYIINYDTYRFLRSIKRTGEIYYLTQNAKALYLQNRPEFVPLFNKIARGVVQTQEPGIMKGPALLGGVYSSPLTVVSFLDLLLTMSHDRKFEKNTVTMDGKQYSLGNSPAVQDAKDAMKIRADAFTVVRIDKTKDLDMTGYTDRKPFFKVSLGGRNFKIGDETVMKIELDKDLDPTEYYALIAVPSTMSVKQTEDQLSDYKGQLIYGQREMGSQKIQLLCVPFRGSMDLTIDLGAAQSGSSDGYVMVRHISDPDVIATVKTGVVTVQ